MLIVNIFTIDEWLEIPISLKQALYNISVFLVSRCIRCWLL